LLETGVRMPIRRDRRAIFRVPTLIPTCAYTELSEKVVARASVDVQAADDVRGSVRRLLSPRQPRLHWHAESTERRTTIAETIEALLPNDLTGYVGRGFAPRGPGQERVRAKCLERLLWDIAQHAGEHQ